MIRLAIDPGDKHVGWAFQDPNEVVTAGEWTISEAPSRVREILWRWSNHARELVIEEFLLYPDKNQSWSPMLTSQLIGALKLIAHDEGVPVLEQGASIKKPTRRQLKARGIKQVEGSVHASDAQLHLWYRILRNRGEGTA